MPKIYEDNSHNHAAQQSNKQETLCNAYHKKTFISIIVALVILSFACGAGVMAYFNSLENTNKTQESTKQEEKTPSIKKISDLPSSEVPEVSDSRGGILIGKDGYGKTTPNAPTVATYFDPLCPGCGNFNRNVDKYLIQMVHAGQINLEIHPMSFLDPLSTDNYSTRVTGAIAYIAEKDDNPEHLLNFINNIFTEEFQPQEGENYQSMPNKALANIAKNAGVPADVANEAFKLHYVKWQEAINSYIPNEKALWNVSGSNKGAMTTPTVTINGRLVDLSGASAKNLTSLDAIVKSLGINKEQVGVADQKPKVTDKDNPLDL